MPAMRVLNVSVNLDPVSGGGTAERTVQLSRALAERQIECAVLTLDINLTAERRATLSQVTIHALPVLQKRFFIPFASLSELAKIVQSADVIHLMGHWTVLNAVTYVLARRYHKPYVLCPAGALQIQGRSRVLKHIYNVLIGSRIVRNAAACIAVTQQETATFDAYDVDLARVRVIPNGIYPPDYLVDATDASGRNEILDAGVPFILFLGRLNPIKGPDLLLRAFNGINARFPKHHVVFAGPDEGMLAGLTRMADSFDLQDRVHFIGYAGGALKANLLRAADILAIPSRFEAMSIVALEAGITATPVLLTDQCGFDVIEDIGGGRVTAATVEGIEAGLTALLSQPDQLPIMGRRLKEFTEKNFHWATIATRHIDTFTQCRGERAS
jgi:glycosyltransferase involved in cell wall biosynthesis